MVDLLMKIMESRDAAKKPNYLVPKAYRVIALLNCLGKVLERILAQRLSYLAKTTHLLHPT